MKILSILAVTLSAGTLFAQVPDQALDARFQLFAEMARPVGITVVNLASMPSVTDEPGRQTGIGFRFLGEIASAPHFYYELGGKGSSSSHFTLNSAYAGNSLNLTGVKVTTSYWSLGAAYLVHPNEVFSLGAHLEGRGEALNAQGPVLQNGQTLGSGPIYISTTYLRPWVRLSADATFHIGSYRPYIGVDVSGAITHTTQTQWVSLSVMDQRTLKALAPRAAAAFYIGARF